MKEKFNLDEHKEIKDNINKLAREIVNQISETGYLDVRLKISIAVNGNYQTDIDIQSCTFDPQNGHIQSMPR